MRSFLTCLCAALLLCSCGDTIKLADRGRSDYRIVVASDADSLTRLTAERFQSYFHQISQAELPIVTDAEATTAEEIVFGRTSRIAEDTARMAALGHDGFVIYTHGPTLYVVGNTSRGTMNGMYTLLDDYLGCRKYSAKVEVIPQRDKVTVPGHIYDRQVPVITFRDVHYRGTNDQGYIDWHKLSHDSTGGKPDWGFWCHSFGQLLPAEQYFKTHPEYFALVGGKRATTQPCLSNPAVLEIMCDNLAKAMAAKPEAMYWSVSSNDNFGYCQCPLCAEVDSIEGSPTGSVIRFVNKVAERFPDKVISTLAYQYSRAAPKVTKPLENVNIMFCNIECNRSEPIATDPTSASFRRDMEEWAKLTDNILVWDYVIQFKNLVSPFPNFHTLQPNIQYFVDNHVVAMFEQGNREVGGEFADLRAYLISKLMWNPSANADSLTNDFLNGYYGPAGVHVKEYINLITNNLIQSGKQLTIFGAPTDGADSYLSPKNLAIYEGCFERAEAAVANQPEYLERVKIARQPLRYAELEQTKLDPYGPNGIYVKAADGSWKTNPEYTKKLEDFIALCKKEGVTRLSEWHTTPDEYLDMMSRISIVRQEGNLSFERPVKLSPAPHPKYGRDADKVLTNGIKGSNDYKIQWLGWDVPRFEAVVDLGSEQEIARVTATYLQALTDWIFFPKQVTFYVSSDGKDYRQTGMEAQPEVNRAVAMGTRAFSSAVGGKGRYVKVVTDGVGICPPWHLGAGGKAFAFMDELIVE